MQILHIRFPNMSLNFFVLSLLQEYKKLFYGLSALGREAKKSRNVDPMRWKTKTYCAVKASSSEH